MDASKKWVLLFVLVSLTAHAQEKQSFLESLRATINQFEAIFFGGSDLKGVSLTSLGHRAQESWGAMDREIQQALDDSTVEDNSSPAYKAEFDRLTQGLPAHARNAQLLINGTASFPVRKELIMNAKKSLHILVWAYYDDLTGKTHSDWLLEKLKITPDLDVKIMVDGPTSLHAPHYLELRRLENESHGKIQVVHWFTGRYRANGSHRKMFIVDEDKVIFGGMNVGDDYSHMNPAVPGWRDTDLLLEGSVARQASKHFAKLWNDQISENHLKVTKIETESDGPSSEEIPVTIVNHHPGSKAQSADHNILTAYAKLISDAKESVLIENAYFIFNKIIKRAITDALGRGVKVRIFTNSDQSVDEPIVSVPILTSAQLAKELGAQVYLRKGTTLHSKFMVIDGKISVIGSDNLHPRSQRFEGEVVSVVFDEKLSKTFTEAFEKDVQEAREIKSPADIKIKKTFSSQLANILFFDHL